jgi:hypothetical protein
MPAVVTINLPGFGRSAFLHDLKNRHYLPSPRQKIPLPGNFCPALAAGRQTAPGPIYLGRRKSMFKQN